MIHILWCTLRPQQFKQMHSEWISRSDKPEDIQTYVAVNWQEHATELKEYLSKNYLITLNTNKIGVCYPSYQLSSSLGVKMGKCEDSDIVIFASDDFMAPKGVFISCAIPADNCPRAANFSDCISICCVSFMTWFVRIFSRT